MNNLESELNCTLFCALTRDNADSRRKRLYEHVAIAYEQLSLREDEIRQNRDLENGLVSIGASENALRLRLLPVLERFHEQYPHVRIRIFNHSTPQAILALESKVVDFAAVTSPLAIQKATAQNAPCLLPRNSDWGTKYKELASQIRSLNDLSGIPFIGLADGTGSRELYHRYFLSHGLMFAPDMEAATTDQILPMITTQSRYRFYPEELVAEAIARGSAYAIRLVEPIPEREICLVTNSSTQMSAAVRKVISFSLNHYRSSLKYASPRLAGGWFSCLFRLLVITSTMIVTT